MTDAKTHYRTILGPIFEWAVSIDGDPFARAAAWLTRHALVDGTTQCLDLGAGFGAHAVALASLGKRVTAVDFDSHLVEQLRGHAARAQVDITIRHGELSDALRRSPAASYDLVLCVGDTLTHLPSVGAVQELFAEAARVVTATGKVAIAFRDTSVLHATGAARFVAVARSSDRALHCLVEPVSHRFVRVTDVVTDMKDGRRRTRIGAYQKLRISSDDAREWADAAGLRIVAETLDAGMTTIVFALRDGAVRALGEVALRVNDLPRMTRFYHEAFRLRLIHETAAAAFLAIAPGHGGHTQVLALFARGVATDTHRTSLDHLAFAIDYSQYEPEKRRLLALGLPVETAFHDWAHWRSLYVRDPEGNQVELVCFDPNW